MRGEDREEDRGVLVSICTCCRLSAAAARLFKPEASPASVWLLPCKTGSRPVGQFPSALHVAILLQSHEQLVRTHPSVFHCNTRTHVCTRSSVCHLLARTPACSCPRLKNPPWADICHLCTCSLCAWMFENILRCFRCR